MKVSEVQRSDIVDYLKLEDGEYTDLEIDALISSAKAYIKSYTGLKDDKIDEHEDITIALYVLCQDMHDNRTMYPERNYSNKVFDTILGMYRVNLLPGGDNG